VVDDIERITPRKYCPFGANPSIVLPNTNDDHRNNLGHRIDRGGSTHFHQFLKTEFGPKLNSKKITPISAQTSTLLTSVTDGKKSKWVPARKPLLNTQN
jgi:hypothetical protein